MVFRLKIGPVVFVIHVKVKKDTGILLGIGYLVPRVNVDGIL